MSRTQTRMLYSCVIYTLCYLRVGYLIIGQFFSWKRKSFISFPIYLFVIFPCLYPGMTKNITRLPGKSALPFPIRPWSQGCSLAFPGCQVCLHLGWADPGSKPTPLDPTQPLNRTADPYCSFSTKHSFFFFFVNHKGHKVSSWVSSAYCSLEKRKLVLGIHLTYT